MCFNNSKLTIWNLSQNKLAKHTAVIHINELLLKINMYVCSQIRVRVEKNDVKVNKSGMAFSHKQQVNNSNVVWLEDLNWC